MEFNCAAVVHPGRRALLIRMEPPPPLAPERPEERKEDLDDRLRETALLFLKAPLVFWVC